MIRRIKFTKEVNGWFAELKEWKGSRADLQMVMGADTFLDILCEGEWDVWITLSDKPMDRNGYEAEQLNLIREDELIGGGHYLLKTYRGIEFNLEMWLCDVTKFVFGNLPKTIYFIA
jgi:hypothetical protein